MMFGMGKKAAALDAGKVLDGIEQAVYEAIKPHGFKKHGRTLHRFVSGDISQVINFQLGPSWRGETHLLFVNIGIRVPECVRRSFAPEEPLQKYYPEYACNLRTRLGEVEGGRESCYDLRREKKRTTADILRQLQQSVLPVFEVLDSREAILAHRREYPRFDLMNDHLILLEEAMIYGCRGEMEKAQDLFNRHYRLFAEGKLGQKDRAAILNHLRYLDGLAKELGIEIKEFPKNI